MTPRYSDRKKTTGKVTLSCGARVGEGHVLDLTVPGCRVKTTYSLAPGQSVHLRMHVGRYLSLRTDLGMVRWVTEGEAGSEFIRMTEEDQLRLDAYVEAQHRVSGVE